MPQFISKLQYKTYEKGEFSDEKVRDLDGSLKLIREFPWDAQRGVDIQPTGPSVTIQNENGEYFRVNLYFNGKFNLYYLDSANHLYEYHSPDLDTAYRLVTDFFNQCLDLTLFEKHLFNIGNQRHFITNHFEYRVKLWRIVTIIGFLSVLAILLAVLDVTLVKKDEFVYPSLIIVTATLVLYYILFKVGRNIMVNRNNYLQISKGNDSFKFGYTENECKVYNKADIDKVVVAQSKGRLDFNTFDYFEIFFKDGSLIKLSTMLIPKFDFINKFPEELIVFDYQRRFS